MKITYFCSFLTSSPTSLPGVVGVRFLYCRFLLADENIRSESSFVLACAHLQELDLVVGLTASYDSSEQLRTVAVRTELAKEEYSSNNRL
jgi:hypothetical protein